MLDFKELWHKALTFDAFVASCKAEHCGLWQGIYNLARVPDWALAAIPSGARRKLLVIAEDWCGDASNTVPAIAKLVDSAPGLELRVIPRDANPDLMNRYLTNGSRS
ncbi:MAG TPA: thioredoxin family protein, partial [Gemmatimonadales bacterium]|nr:thioredoxin family protein [Gemmatimonadales bacterium]